jgi:hypothetical protein
MWRNCPGVSNGSQKTDEITIAYLVEQLISQKQEYCRHIVKMYAPSRYHQHNAPAGLLAVEEDHMATLKELSEAEIAIIKARIIRGDKYSDIASDYRVNQGRISDPKFGRLYPKVAPAKLNKPEARKEH